MKYFFGLIIILFAVAYQISSNNDESLSEAESETENTYQNIDLKKITISTQAPKETVEIKTITTEVPAASEEINNPDQTEEAEESEEHKEYFQSKYSLDADQINKPEMSRSEMEIIKKHTMEQSRLRNTIKTQPTSER